jgi:hypothetical protein
MSAHTVFDRDTFAQPRLDLATRNVRAVLIAGDQIDSPGLPAPSAARSLDIVETDLKTRFETAATRIDRLRGPLTKHRVARALEAMSRLVQRDELFVVMFAGHGTPSHGAAREEGWALTADDVFTDHDLATALCPLVAGVDTVVVSNCCFGEGMFRAARVGRPLGHRASAQAPMVCISASGAHDLVKLTKLVDLASETVAAATAQRSYRQLAETFAARAVAGCTFHVDARPARRLDDAVLSHRHPGITPAPAASPDVTAPSRPIASFEHPHDHFRARHVRTRAALAHRRVRAQ